MKSLKQHSLQTSQSAYFGYDEFIQQIQTFISFQSSNLHILHLYGQPGIGKTAIIKNIQNRQKQHKKIILINVCNLFGIKINEIKKLLQQYQENYESAIIVFDQIEMLNNIKNQFAQVIREFIKNWKSKVILITQHQDGVNWLQVQIGKTISLRKPNQKQISQIVSHLLSQNQSITHINLPSVASAYLGRTPSEIIVFVKQASMSKLRQYINENPGCLDNNSEIDKKILEIDTQDLLKTISAQK